MFRGLVFFVINVLVIMFLSFILPEFKVVSILSAATLVIVLTLLNWTLGGILKLFTLPLNFLSFGLLGFIINIFVLWVSLNIPQGVTISGSGFSQLLTLLIISVSLSIGQGIGNAIFPDRDED
jgi:putative membrane protein